MESQMTEQQIISTYKGLISEVRQLSDKIAELDMDVHEHERVLKTLTGLEPERKAYRMVGGVLVQRSIKEILPAVETNKTGILQILNQLHTKLKDSEKQTNDWQKKYNIQMQE